MSTINSVTATGTTAPADTTATSQLPVQTLNQKDFLTLLVTQMTTQDPMNPLKDTEFIAQMAQFSSLEQSKTMQQDMAQLRAESLLGRTVQLEADDGSAQVGTVNAVGSEAGTPKIYVHGVAYDLSQVRAVMDAAQ